MYALCIFTRLDNLQLAIPKISKACVLSHLSSDSFVVNGRGAKIEPKTLFQVRMAQYCTNIKLFDIEKAQWEC